MKIRKLAAVSALTIGALAVAGGTAYADPAAPVEPSPVVAPAGDPSAFVNFVAAQILDPSANSASVNTPLGSLTVTDGQIQATAPTGEVLGSASLAPATDLARALGQGDVLDRAADALATDPAAATRPVPVTPVLDYGWKTEGEREQWAFKRAQDSIATAAAVAAATGLAGGAVVGCGAGALFGTVATLPAFGLLGGGPLIGCLLGAPLGAALGGMVTAAVVTVPVAIASGVGYFNTINSPFVPPKSSPQKVQIVE